MGSTYRYISNQEENALVTDWFSSFDPEILKLENSIIISFPSIGKLDFDENGVINTNNSPVVSIYPVKSVCGVLLSVGEVHFLPTKLNKNFPKLESINRKFRSWLKKNELVYSSNTSWHGQWNYFLEGSVKNYDTDIYAFQKGITLLENGQYFVSNAESKGRLETLRKSLLLRGVTGLKDA